MMPKTIPKGFGIIKLVTRFYAAVGGQESGQVGYNFHMCCLVFALYHKEMP